MPRTKKMHMDLELVRIGQTCGIQIYVARCDLANYAVTMKNREINFYAKSTDPLLRPPRIYLEGCAVLFYRKPMCSGETAHRSEDSIQYSRFEGLMSLQLAKGKTELSLSQDRRGGPSIISIEV